MNINEKLSSVLTDTQKLFWIKLFLLCNGIRVQDWEHEGMRRAGPSTGIELMLSLGGALTAVKVPRYVTRRTVAKLEGNQISINGKVVCEASVIPLPTWYKKEVRGYPVAQILNAHGRFLVSSVYEQCVLFAAKKACIFCSMNESLVSRELKFKSPELIVESLEYALRFADYQGLILNGGMLFDRSGGIKNYLAVVMEVRKRFPSLAVTVESTPPKDTAWVERLVEAGVSSLTMNLETWNPVARASIVPGKNEFYTLDDYYRSFEVGIRELGKGKVSSCIVFGTEALETAQDGVRELTSRDVIVSPIARRYYDDIPFRDGPNPNYEEFAQILSYTKERHGERRLTSFFGCQKCNMCDPIGDTP